MQKEPIEADVQPSDASYPTVILTPRDAAYPDSLRVRYGHRAPALESSRELDFGPPRVAIVGSRKAQPSACAFARKLASACAEAGAIVLSGGAQGIDAAAHHGALDANGRTWVIAPHGRLAPEYPKSNRALFRRVRASMGAHVWPFSERTFSHYLERNEVLVTLADVVVVVQARKKSGSMNTARATLEQKKPLWAVCSTPMIDERAQFDPLDPDALEPAKKRSRQPHLKDPDYDGGTYELIRNPEVRLLRDIDEFIASWRTRVEDRENEDEAAILQELAKEQPLHRERLAERAQLTPQELSVALFGLLLEGVVHEHNGYLQLTRRV